jgi:RNA polymerase sigma factor (sigma-70 family)
MESVTGLVGVVGQLALRHGPWTYQVQDREDIVQEGCVGLLEAASRYEADRGASLRTFAGRRADGAMMDRIRTLARTRARETGMGGVPDAEGGRTCGSFPAEGRSPESRELILRFSWSLRARCGTLPGRERDAVGLRYFEGLSVRDTAARMGTSPATVVRLERSGLDRLRADFLASRCGRDL